MMKHWSDSYRDCYSRIGLIFSLSALLCASFLLSAPQARAGITISPLRAVLTEESRSIEISVRNSSQQLLDADISLIDLAATPEGYAAPLPRQRDEVSATPWLVVSPTTFSLEPGAQQTVTLHFRDDKTAPTREYRSHLFIETVPTRGNVHAISAHAIGPDTNTGLALDARMAISIPIMVRPAGLALPKVLLKDPKLVRSDNGSLGFAARLTLPKSAPHRSVHGAVKIIHTPTRPGEAKLPTRILENVVIYPDAGSRKVTIPLGQDDIQPGELQLVWEGRFEDTAIRPVSRTFKIDG